MPKLGLGLGLPKTRFIGGSGVTPIIPKDDLSLWLVSDSGVTISPYSYNYASQIVISGTASGFNGTYTATQTPSFVNGAPTYYEFSSSSDYNMVWDAIDNLFYLGNGESGFSSSDGITWNIYNQIITEFTVTGFTGIYAGANGTYSSSDGNNYSSPGSTFAVSGGYLYDIDGIAIAVMPYGLSGSWTPTTYLSSVELTGGGSPEVNGVYTRTDSQINVYYDSFFASGSRHLQWDNNAGYFFTTNSEYGADPADWTWYQNYGDSPAPTSTLGYSNRSIGSPTSQPNSIFPTGAISGVVTTTTVNGSQVTLWKDQSGNGNDATVYNNTQLIPNELNGKPVVTFDGSSSYAQFPIFLPEDVSRTIFVVGKYNYLGGGQSGLIALTQDENVDRGYLFKSGGTAYYYSGGVQISAGTTYSIGDYHITTIRHVYGDNSEMAVNNDYGADNLMPPPGVTGGYIAWRGSSGEYAWCNIAEIIIYNRELDLSERTQVQTYLNSKYVIY